MYPSAVRRIALVATAIAAALAAIPGPPPATSRPAPPGFRDADYWRFADRIAAQLDRVWDDAAGRYVPGSGGVETMFNADMLLVHAAAAEEGHQGPARNDERARALARALTATPPYVTRPGRRTPGTQAHVPGWVSTMTSTVGNQHLVIDSQVVDGLVHAWRARRALRLPDALADRIAQTVHRTARGPYWRWPALRLNQLNWHALVSAGDATVTGAWRRAGRDIRRHIERFAAGVRSSGSSAGNLGPGLRFHYLPARPRATRFNLDSAEYANIVASFARFYEPARRTGMARPSARALRLVRDWMRRVLTGSVCSF